MGLKRFSHPERRRTLLRLAGLWIGVVVLAVVVGYFTRGRLEPTRLRQWVEESGTTGIVLFMLFSAVAPLFLIPASPLTVATGLLFPWPLSLLIAVVSRNATANLGFALGRLLGRDRVSRMIGHDLDRYVRRLRKQGLLAVITVRVIPVAPFTAVSMACGISGVRWLDYALGSFLGMLPGACITLFALHMAVG